MIKRKLILLRRLDIYIYIYIYIYKKIFKVHILYIYIIIHIYIYIYIYIYKRYIYYIKVEKKKGLPSEEIPFIKSTKKSYKIFKNIYSKRSHKE
jgi:hypothetical protein